MLVGLSFLSSYTDDSSILEEKNTIGKIVNMNLKKSIVDELHFNNDVTLERTATKKNWDAFTLFLATFRNSFEVGNIGFDDNSITGVKFLRRNYGELDWQEIATFTYDGINDIFEATDRYVQATAMYEYAVVPIAGTLEGNYVVSDPFEVSFDGCFIMSKFESYKLELNIQIGDIQHNKPSAVLTPMSGTRFPIVIYNGDLLYKSGSISALLYTGIDGNIDKRTERVFRGHLLDYLTDGQPKILKSFDGLYMMINIIDNPTLTPFGNIGGVYSVSFNYVEVGDPYSDEDLQSAGLKDV